MQKIVFSLPGAGGFASRLAASLTAASGELECRDFPDGETYVRVLSPVRQREALIVARLDQPNARVLPVLFLAQTLKELGAGRVGLVAAYLPYMRQDQRFRDGEALTAACFGELLSRRVNWLVTVDPHLHRISSLSDFYSIPARPVRSAPAIADWIRARLENPLLIGPDRESEQWVRDVADRVRAPCVIFDKTRFGDREVRIDPSPLNAWPGHTPVILDDIISTGTTMIRTMECLRGLALAPPVCIGIHAVFAGSAHADLLRAGAGRVVTCNTITHHTNAIFLEKAVAVAVDGLLSEARCEV